MTEYPTTTIIGERQSGKTGTLLAVAEQHARSGRKVLFATENRNMARDALERAAQVMRDVDVYRTEGAGHVSFIGRGRIDFITHSEQSPRGLNADTLILDGWAEGRPVDDFTPLLRGCENARLLVGVKAEYVPLEP